MYGAVSQQKWYARWQHCQFSDDCVLIWMNKRTWWSSRKMYHVKKQKRFHISFCTQELFLSHRFVSPFQGRLLKNRGIQQFQVQNCWTNFMRICTLSKNKNILLSNKQKSVQNASSKIKMALSISQKVK